MVEFFALGRISGCADLYCDQKVSRAVAALEFGVGIRRLLKGAIRSLPAFLPKLQSGFGRAVRFRIIPFR